MQINHASALRGLSIAVIILSGLMLLACLIGLIALGIGGTVIADYGPDIFEDSYYYDGYYYDSSLSASEMSGLMGLMLGLGGVAIVWEVICGVVALVAGILGLRGYNDPAKLGTVFGMAIAGAVLSFLGGSIIVMVLLIIVAVFASKDRSLAAAGYYAAPAAAAPVAAQPVAAAPVAAQPAAAVPVAQQAQAANPVPAPPAEGQSTPNQPSA